MMELPESPFRCREFTRRAHPVDAQLSEWPLFVVGVWRSGTSLLYALLNKHPKIALMYEADLFMLRQLFRVPGARSDWLARWEFWNDAPRRHAIDLGTLPPNLCQIRAAMEVAHKQYANERGAIIWGDKSPNYYDSLTDLYREFPGARFIIIWRDLASICRSVIRAAQEHTWFERRGMTHRVLIGYRVLKKECDRLMGLGARVHQMQYELLVRDPAGVLQQACTFLGVPFTPEIAALEGADRSAIYDGAHHSFVKGERIISHTGDQEVLSTKLKAKIERYTSLWLHQTGGAWPVALNSANMRCPAMPAGLMERVVDSLLFRCFSAFDKLVVLTYALAPFPLLGALRALGRRHRQGPGNIAEPEPSSGAK
jgi:hypothetical protein